MDIVLTCFDFDGTLRDGLKEKVFAFQTAIEITSRIMGFSTDRPYLDDDMRALAGVAVGKIAVQHWPEAYASGTPSQEAFRQVYEQVWKDIYNFYNITQRDPSGTPPTTAFTDEEKQKIIEGMPQAAWFDGAKDLLVDLHDRGVYTAVLSNTPEVTSLKNEVASGGVLDAVDCVFTGSPVGMGKPNAYALLHLIAMSWTKEKDPELNAAIQEAYDQKNAELYKERVDASLSRIAADGSKISVLVIGDGLPDIRVAKNAAETLRAFGIKNASLETLALTYGFMTKEQLAPEEPDLWAFKPREMVSQTTVWALRALGLKGLENNGLATLAAGPKGQKLGS